MMPNPDTAKEDSQGGEQNKMPLLAAPRDIPLVIVSGLPASGKSTLSRNLSAALSLSLLDKDDILEALFETLGIGDADWRQLLSRTSDEILQRLASSSSGAVITSFWRHPEISSLSGAPTDWINSASRRVVEIYCECDPQVAAARFIGRNRHPGHLDSLKRVEDVLTSFQTLAARGPLGVGKLLRVDTSGEIEFEKLVGEVQALLRR
jgi:gluconate kinase